MKRFCPHCAQEYFGTPYCSSCGAPLQDEGVEHHLATPPPEPAEQEEAHPPLARPIRRLGALIVDSVIVTVSASFLLTVASWAYSLGSGLPSVEADEELLETLVTMLWITYNTLFIGASGQTPGKSMLGLQVIRVKGGGLSYLRALLRTLLYYLSAAPLCLGFLWAFWDRRRQGWHDKLAGTLVIRNR